MGLGTGDCAGFRFALGVLGKERVVLIYMFLGLYCCREEGGCWIG